MEITTEDIKRRNIQNNTLESNKFYKEISTKVTTTIKGTRKKEKYP